MYALSLPPLPLYPAISCLRNRWKAMHGTFLVGLLIGGPFLALVSSLALKLSSAALLSKALPAARRPFPRMAMPTFLFSIIRGF